MYLSKMINAFLHKCPKALKGCQQATPTQGMKTSVDTLTRISIRHSIGKRASTDELMPIIKRFQREDAKSLNRRRRTLYPLYEQSSLSLSDDMALCGRIFHSNEFILEFTPVSKSAELMD